MGDLVITLDAATAQKLRARALVHHRSVEAELREIVENLPALTGAERAEIGRRIRAMTPPRPQTDSVEILRTIRDERRSGG